MTKVTCLLSALPPWGRPACRLAILGMAMTLLANHSLHSREIDYQRDIQPILSEHCAQCHGVDSGARQAALRLDLREYALKGGESGLPAIVPGKPDNSEIIRRATSSDPDEQMPPPHYNKPLSPEQKEVLNQWIAQGAPYAVHWSFQPPAKKQLSMSSTLHPIDELVREQLDPLGLQPSPPADDATLCRRLYLDLIGLPPSLDELAEYRATGHQATVQRLLQSERYGEKWARHWLDVARYSDSNGYEKDVRREQWAWRDWVVRALNQDVPYDQFIVEQIAGDLLPNANQDQIVATGFLRNSMINEEGAIVAEQFRKVEMFDRIDCVGKAVLGLTTQCAQCHTHKFDPITQTEYYGMFACLNNSYEAKSWVYTNEQLQEIDRIHLGTRTVEERLRTQTPNWRQQLSSWEAETKAKTPNWQYLAATELGCDSGLLHPTQEDDKSLLFLGHPSGDAFMIATPELLGVTGIRLEVLTHGDLPLNGPGRGPIGAFALSELKVSLKKPSSDAWEKLKLVNATADFSEPDQKSADGKQVGGSVNFAIDENEATAWRADRGVGRRNQSSVAVFQFEKPLDVPPGTQFRVDFKWIQEAMVGCCRLSVTKDTSPSTLPIAHSAQLALDIPVTERTMAQQESIFKAWYASRPDYAPLTEEVNALWQKFPVAETTILHLKERELGKMRVTQRLDRGEWDQPRETVQPHTPGSFFPMAEDDSPDRLRFARWLVDRRSPLAARVAVNRVWQAMFGDGLVETSEDFGTRASVPEQLELLDWLAVDFMEHGWSHKHLIEFIVTSQTYRQTSQADLAARELDPRNRWLARGPRFRAEAEVVRDIALSVSGLLTNQLGGEAIFPPVPKNVLDYNFTYPT
ncbi:MAG: PSD1 and planctomycete cytochrome C domain-containing protein, partial [Planctomycetota bacterium]|nr:PSD1 and planctomycete cytochrome C domain-containing protein [Planctomycetota bacterium]